MAWETFACWYGLLSYLEDHTIVHYQAPLDYSPVPVVVVRKFKNGKLRIRAPHLTFTADAGHLDRFRWKSDPPMVGYGATGTASLGEVKPDAE